MSSKRFESSTEEDVDPLLGSHSPSNASLPTIGGHSAASRRRVRIHVPSTTAEYRSHSKWRMRLYLTLLSIFSATGGFLFGYDTGVVSGAMIKIDEQFDLTQFWHELIVASTIGAAVLSAALGGVLSEILGRKPLLLLTSAVFTIGTIVMTASPLKEVLLVGRIIVGLGIGSAAMVVPMYIAESAPANIRGELVVVNNLFITGGQFIATLVDGLFSNVYEGWRYMLGMAGIPSLFMFIGFCFMPESPRWLVFHNKETKAYDVLNKLRDPALVSTEFDMISDDYKEYKKNKLGFLSFLKKFITSKSVLLALFVGCGLQAFQQLAGINTVMYYGASIIQMAGFTDNGSIWLACIPAFGNFIFTVVGLLLVDRIGRRKLLIGSLVGVVIGLLLLSCSFIAYVYTSPSTIPLNETECNYDYCGMCVANSHCGYCSVGNNNTDGTCSLGNKTFSNYLNDENHCLVYNETTDYNATHWNYNNCPGTGFNYAWLTIPSLFIYIMFFAPGMGPLPWTINSEIYPNWARSTCIAIATAVNWIFNLVVALTFLTLSDTLGPTWTFALYAGLAFMGLLFVISFVPETKGQSLEQVEKLFKKPYFVSCSSCHRESEFSIN